MFSTSVHTSFAGLYLATKFDKACVKSAAFGMWARKYEKKLSNLLTLRLVTFSGLSHDNLYSGGIVTQLLRDRFTIDKPRAEWRMQFLNEKVPLGSPAHYSSPHDCTRTLSPSRSWYSFYQPQEDGRLSQGTWYISDSWEFLLTRTMLTRSDDRWI